MAEDQTREREVLDAAVDALTRRLPPSWTVERVAPTGDSGGGDLLVKTPNAGNQAVLLVEVKTSVSPRDVEALMDSPWARRWRRQIGNQPLLLVASYIGPRVRDLLVAEKVSYLDLTGNSRISVEHPGIFIETQGASRDPRSSTPRTTLRGAKAGSIVRILVDVRPPYSGAQIARAANVNEGYLSRILDALVDEGLIERDRPGPVTRVDWPALLRRRAQTLDLFRPPGTYRYVARQGADALLDRLRSRPGGDRRLPTVTGSFAAARLAPVAAPTLLVLYAMNPHEMAAELDLLPADAGADTVLIRPDNDIAFEGAQRDGGIAWAAPSQVAIDCLVGTGRMPSEGEALIDWMQENEDLWRYPSIGAVPTGRADQEA